MVSTAASAVDRTGPRGSTGAGGGRVHGLDALRGGALLLGIVFHALMPFVPGGYWMFKDVVSAPAAGTVVDVVHLFRMVLFMALAGYFGAMVTARRGPGRYLRDRALRIGLPFVALWPVAVLPSALVSVLDQALRGTEPQPLPAEITASPLLLFPPSHLWFLLVLIELVVLVLAGRALLVKLAGAERCARAARRIGAVLSSPAGLLLAAVPFASALLLQGRTDGWISQPVTILPELAPLVGYGGAFLVGWFLRRDEDALRRLAARWPVALGAGAALTAVLETGLADAWPLPVHALAGGIAAWALGYGLVGLCTRYLTRERPLVRYLADASYWLYLMHIVLLGVFGVLVADLHWPVVVKLVLVLAGTVGLLLLSYDLLVRPTWLGRWLNGHRRPSALRAAVDRTRGRRTARSGAAG